MENSKNRPKSKAREEPEEPDIVEDFIRDYLDKPGQAAKLEENHESPEKRLDSAGYSSLEDDLSYQKSPVKPSKEVLDTRSLSHAPKKEDVTYELDSNNF